MENANKNDYILRADYNIQVQVFDQVSKRLIESLNCQLKLTAQFFWSLTFLF